MHDHQNEITKLLTGEEIKANPDMVAEKAPTQRLDADTGKFRFTGRSIGTHVDGHTQEGGQRVESRPAEGGTAVSEAAADHSYRASLTGHLLRGEDGESRAVRILAAKLRILGHEVIELSREEAKNERGEDRKLLIDSAEQVVQVVTMPVDDPVWKDLRSKGTAETLGHDAVKLVRACIEKKCNKAKGTILALDAAHIGAVVSQALVDAYIKAHGDPNKECGFAQTWIVGPTEARTFKIA